MLSSFLLYFVLLSLSSPYCLVVFPPFVLSFFLSFFLFSIAFASFQLCSAGCDGEWQRLFPCFKTSSSLFSYLSHLLLSQFLSISFFFSSFPVPPLAFIARGCMRYGRHMVTVGVHYGGEEISRKTCP